MSESRGLQRCSACLTHVKRAADGQECPNCGAALTAATLRVTIGGEVSRVLRSGRSAALATALGVTMTMGVAGCSQEPAEPAADMEVEPDVPPAPPYGLPPVDMGPDAAEDMEVEQDLPAVPPYGTPPIDMEGDLADDMTDEPDEASLPPYGGPPVGD